MWLCIWSIFVSGRCDCIPCCTNRNRNCIIATCSNNSLIKHASAYFWAQNPNYLRVVHFPNKHLHTSRMYTGGFVLWRPTHMQKKLSTVSLLSCVSTRYSSRRNTRKYLFVCLFVLWVCSWISLENVIGFRKYLKILSSNLLPQPRLPPLLLIILILLLLLLLLNRDEQGM